MTPTAKVDPGKQDERDENQHCQDECAVNGKPSGDKRERAGSYHCKISEDFEPGRRESLRGKRVVGLRGCICVLHGLGGRTEIFAPNVTARSKPRSEVTGFCPRLLPDRGLHGTYPETGFDEVG